MKKVLVSLFVILLGNISIVKSQNVSQNYLDIQTRLAQGWNTWSYGSMLTHVLLPEGLSMQINLRQSFIGTPGDRKFFISEFNSDTSGLVRPIAHSFDGSYTELLINNWKGNTIRVQSASKGNDIAILVTPIVRSPNIRYNIELETGILWNREGSIRRSGKTIKAKFKDSEYIIRSTSPIIETFHSYPSPYLVFKGDTAIALYTGTEKSLSDIEAIIEQAKNEYNSYALKYGKLAEGFKCIQSVLGWNTIYDAEKNRIITPVARDWNLSWQGYVLFAWDTYFASYLFALDNKDLAYSNAIAITKGMNHLGYVGQWQMPGMVAQGISNPPVGSMVCWMIYEKYREKWFLEEVYNELISWNRWWVNNRIYKNFLTWGCEKGDDHKMAELESGLDNSPMYDDAKIVDVGNNSLMDLADVGLNSIYAADCKYLAKIAQELGKTDDKNELTARAVQFEGKLQTLWNEKSGLFLNKYPDQQIFSKRLSPTLFYPMLAGSPNQKQAQRMIKEHFYNPDEFYSNYMLPSCAFNDKSYDNNYWRGAVWGPMNFLVYLGLRDYDKKAASELSDKSYDMFIKSWERYGTVFENINSQKGVDKRKDQLNSDPFYHWGALMGVMKFMDKGIY
jgi:hypothetical protein